MRRSTPSLRDALLRVALACNFQSKSQVKITSRIFIEETSAISVPTIFIGLQCETAAALRLDGATCIQLHLAAFN